MPPTNLFRPFSNCLMTNEASNYAINLVGCDLYLNGSREAIRLRRMEARLLAALLRYRNQYVSRATLMRWRMRCSGL